jgi:ADP-ribosylglycohydrolase
MVDGVIDVVGGLEYLTPEEDEAMWRRILSAPAEASPDELVPNGFVVTSLRAAAWAVTSTTDGDPATHAERGLRAAVALGDDTDTTAAIAGGLLGARYGVDAFPLAWRANLGGWPTGLDAAGLEAMARRAVAR